MLRLYMSRTIVLLRFQAISKLQTRRASEHAQPLNAKKTRSPGYVQRELWIIDNLYGKGSEATKIFLAKRKYVTDRFRDL